ncbi:MAG TPA: hypothetical protein VMS94_05585 [Acidobacteriota bacterium]|nr:hypothetical protein [Acidobacteriota bacterium]
MKQCPCCQCTFGSQEDLDLHMKEFGSNREEHCEKMHKVHGRMEHGSYESEA